MRMMGFNVLKQIAFRLLTKTEGLDDGTVAIDIAVVQVIEQCATLSYNLLFTSSPSRDPRGTT